MHHPRQNQSQSPLTVSIGNETAQPRTEAGEGEGLVECSAAQRRVKEEMTGLGPTFPMRCRARNLS